MNNFPSYLALVIVAMFSLDSFAATVRVDFQGVVDHVDASEGVNHDDYLGGKVVVGTPFSGSFHFDDSATDLGMGFVANTAVYQYQTPPNGMSVEIGGFTFRSDPLDTQFVIAVANNMEELGGVGSGDTYAISSVRDEIVVGSDGLMSFQPEIVLELSGDSSVRDSVELITTPEGHGVYPNSRFAVQGFDVNDRDKSFLIHSGEVSFVVSVPEPASQSLLVFATGTAIIYIRRQTRR